MFQSEKGLRKGIAVKRAGPSALSSTLKPPSAARGSSDIVNVAKKEREARQLDRQEYVQAVMLQKWWKCCHSKWMVFKEVRQRFDSKLSDIERLAALLKVDTSALVPSATTTVEMLKLICFRGCKLTDVSRWLRFGKLVLNASLLSPDNKKNVSLTLSQEENQRLLDRLLSALVFVLAAITKKRVKLGSLEDKTVLAETLVGLLGGFPNYKMRFPESLELSFRHLREILDCKNLFQRLRGLLVLSSDHLVGGLEEDQGTISHPQAAGNLADALMESCFVLVDSEEDLREKRFAAFFREIFSVPMLTFALSQPMNGRLTSWLFSTELFLKELDKPILALPSSPHDVFSSGQWLAANTYAVIAFLPIVSSAPEHSVPAQVLANYLDRCSSLLCRYYIPGVFQGKNGVVWTKAGASMMAAGVPAAMQRQLLELLHPSVTSSLFERVLLPVRLSLSTCDLPGERARIQEALTSSSIVLSKEIVSEEDAARAWFTSKWAGKILKKVGTHLGISSAKSSKTEISNSGTTGTASELPSLNVPEDNLPAAVYEMSFDLIRSLMSLWAILFSSAAVAPMDSLPWRRLTSLCYSTRLVDRVWAALLQAVAADDCGISSSGGRSFVEAAASFLTLPSFFGSKKTKSSNPTVKPDGLDIVAVNQALSNYCVNVYDPLADALARDRIFSMLSVLATSLRIYITATSDFDLYNQEKPLPLHQMIQVIGLFKHVLYRTLQDNATVITEPSTSVQPSSTPNDMIRFGTMKCMVSVLTDLYSRWARRPFSRSDVWKIAEANSSASFAILTDISNPWTMSLYKTMPWAVTFPTRLQLFRNRIDSMRVGVQGVHDPLHGGYRSRGVVVRVRKALIVEDGMAALTKVAKNTSSADGAGGIRDRIIVRYINNFGEEEAGIDAGGLFKDLLTDLSNRVFDPTYVRPHEL